MTLGMRLKKARKDKKYTQQFMADSLGIAKSTYCGWESDFRKPDVLMVQKAAMLLEVSGSYLIGATVDEPKHEDTIYISRPSGDPTIDELRKRLHQFIDELDEDSLRNFTGLFIKTKE